ncbi:MAG: hypothetical protein ABIE43_01885 [Patescibacteria group bacterium]
MDGLKHNQKRIISLKIARKLLVLIIFVLFFDLLFFAMPILVNEVVEEAKNMQMMDEIATIIMETKVAIGITEHLPENKIWQVKSSSFHTITSYNSEVGQTDSTPCITANGFNVCEHGIEDTIAANFLKFGTKVRLPELFGDKVFVVRDRMNKRYSNRLDVWMLNKQDAKQFGVKLAKVEVLE